jgi:hypothetical protein
MEIFFVVWAAVLYVVIVGVALAGAWVTIHERVAEAGTIWPKPD